MNNSDYKADLDAVNLSRLFVQYKDKSIYEIFTKYYNDIKDNKLNRASEFENNIGIDTLNKTEKHI